MGLKDANRADIKYNRVRSDSHEQGIEDHNTINEFAGRTGRSRGAYD